MITYYIPFDDDVSLQPWFFRSWVFSGCLALVLMDKILGVSLGIGEQWKQTNKKSTHWDIKGTVNEESSGTSVLSFYRKCF